MKLKRYLLFAYDQYYPGGGFEDFIEDFGTESEAKAAELLQVDNCDFTEIIDIENYKEEK